MHETRQDGGICGFVQDNGSYQKAWVLGYDGDRFAWTLAAVGPAGADGGLTKVRSRSTVERGRWHHVAGTYGGGNSAPFRTPQKAALHAAVQDLTGCRTRPRPRASVVECGAEHRFWQMPRC